MNKNLKITGGPGSIDNPEMKPDLDRERLMDSIVSRVQGAVESTSEFLYIISLIERICDPEQAPIGISSTTTISWKAYREAEAFLGDKFIPAIVRYIEGARDERKRVAAYFALRNAIINADGVDPEAVQYMVNLVGKESKRYALCDLLMNLNQINNKPQGIDYGPIYSVIETNRFGFASEAISALNGAKDPFAEDFLLSILEMSKNRDMLIQANAVLSSIGTGKSLPYLEKFAKKRGNIGQSAKFAIGKIGEKQRTELFRHLNFTALLPESVHEVSEFFNERMHEMNSQGHDTEDIEWNCANHTVQEISEKIQDPTRYFEIVRDDRTDKIIAYFESRPVKRENEEIGGQFIQWVFVHPEYEGNGIARRLFYDFHTFCISHGYAYASSLAMRENKPSQEMHKSLGYKRLPKNRKDPESVYYRKDFNETLGLTEKKKTS